MNRRLIATDLDGTLLRSDVTVSPRVVDAVAAAMTAGWIVLPISGRMPFSLRPIAESVGLHAHAIGANGAVGLDFRASGWLFESSMEVEAQTELVVRMQREVPGLKVAAVRDGGHAFLPELGYLALMGPGDHGRDIERERERDLAEVLAEPAIKVVLRHAEVVAEELLALAEELAVPGVHPSISGAPFLEVAGAGVNKATGLALMCELLGVDQANTVAFGDHFNDKEMIAWAGHGVAMGNAVDDVKAVADEVAPTNDEDGLAAVIERLLA